MVLHRQLLVHFLDVLVGGTMFYTKHFVEILEVGLVPVLADHCESLF